MRRSLYIRTLIMRSADYPYIIRIVLYLNINAYLAQLCRNRLKVLRYNVLQRNATINVPASIWSGITEYSVP